MRKPLSRARNGRQHTEAILVAAPERRAQAHLVVDRRRDLRSRQQAQARRRDARGARGDADPRRSRRRRGGEDFRGDRCGPLRQGDLARRSESGGRRGSRENARAGCQAAVGRGCQTVRHSCCRRQWLRQDHHHRQARVALSRRRPQGDARRRRHLPRRRHRSAENLGRAHRRAGDRARAGLRCGEPRLRSAHRGEGAGRRCPARRHRRAAAEQGRPDGASWKRSCAC